MDMLGCAPCNASKAREHCRIERGLRFVPVGIKRPGRKACGFDREAVKEPV